MNVIPKNPFIAGNFTRCHPYVREIHGYGISSTWVAMPTARQSGGVQLSRSSFRINRLVERNDNPGVEVTIDTWLRRMLQSVDLYHVK